VAETAFVDTNVLVYLVDRSEPDKRRRAAELLASEAGALVLSAQVLSEFYAVVTRKLADPLSEEVASRLVERFSHLRTVSIDAPLVRSAIAISREAGLSYWDGLIVAGAKVGGCTRLLTEDLSAESVVAGVRVENPFG
jgi:predicted nucleic acid-binding protein